MEDILGYTVVHTALHSCSGERWRQKQDADLRRIQYMALTARLPTTRWHSAG